MTKIVKNKKTECWGILLIELDTGWNVVSENGSCERYPEIDFSVIEETDLLRISPPSATETTQQEVVASA
jgi:hypothetical protein